MFARHFSEGTSWLGFATTPLLSHVRPQTQQQPDQTGCTKPWHPRCNYSFDSATPFPLGTEVLWGGMWLKPHSYRVHLQTSFFIIGGQEFGHESVQSESENLAGMMLFPSADKII